MLIKMKKGLVLIISMLFLSACNNDEDLWRASSLSAVESDSVPGAETESLSVFTTMIEQEKILDFSSSSIAAHDGGNIDREITGLDFETLNSKEAVFGQWSNDSFTFDTFTYVVEYDGETYTTETNPERFNENFRCIEGKWEKSDQRYKKINLGEQIAETEVTECSYTCESFDSREGIRTEPFRAALTLSGTVTLEGVIAYAEEGDDYWNVYADTVLFFPYADSLKESRIPLLHTEKIDTVYYENSVPVFGFSGETLPFELGGSTDEFYNGKTFAEFLGAQKFREATIQFEEVVQSWMYMNGSGWSPCKAKIMKITLISSQHTLELTPQDTSENLSITVSEYQVPNDPAESVESDSTKDMLKTYISFARSEIKSAFLNGDECTITLRNVFGNEKPEMIVGIRRNPSSVNHEYYFSTDENDEPIYIGEFYRVHDVFYTDGEFVYAIWEDDTAMLIEKIQYPIEDTVSPDLAEYQNSDALSFMKNTSYYFIRYDDENWINPEDGAAMFYCEDSDLYEAYSVSRRILDLTSIEIGDYINGDGNLIYSYLPGENYIVSRREYEQIKSKTFEILTEVADESEISSGWINIDDIDQWLDFFEISGADEPVPTMDISSDSDDGTLDEWLKENLWNIIGNINLANLPEVRDYVNPRSAKLYIADIDGDGNFELIHSLFTGTYTTIDSVYKLNGTELYFYGYYYSGLYTEESDFIDGVYTNGSEQRYFCSRYVTLGGSDQPYWIRIYEMKFGAGIELVPIISAEWAPSSHDGEYRLVKAEYDGGVIYDENEYRQWLSDFWGDYTAAGDFLNIIDSMDVPFSIGAKEFTSDEKEQEIIDWICTGLTKNSELAESGSGTPALRKEKCTKTLVDSFRREIVHELKCSSEQEIIYDLMDRDVICYFTFRYASSAIEEEAQYQGDIFEIKKHALFKNYSELKNFVYDTYTEENAEKLLKESDLDQALYLSKDQSFLYHAENLGIVIFDFFSEGYEVEITNIGDDEIEFICYSSVWQDEEMKPVEKAFLCRAQKTEGNLWKLDRNIWLH